MLVWTHSERKAGPVGYYRKPEPEEEGLEFLNMQADLLGVPRGATVAETRRNVDVALGNVAAGTPWNAAAAKVGDHPDGRASTLDELMVRFLSGELKDDYELPEPEGDPIFEWFTAEDKANYGVSDGLHTGGHSYQYCRLWYQLLGEEFDLIELGDWRVAHGGLRLEYVGSGAVDHGATEGAFAAAYERFQEVYQAVQSGYQPVETPPVAAAEEGDFLLDADELLKLLED